MYLLKTNKGLYIGLSSAGSLHQTPKAKENERIILERYHDNRVSLKIASGYYIGASADTKTITLSRICRRSEKFWQEVHAAGKFAFKTVYNTYLSAVDLSQEKEPETAMPLRQNIVCMSSEKFEYEVLVKEGEKSELIKPSFPVGTFYIRSKLNGLFLDAKGEGKSEGTHVITYNPKPKSPNQQWSFEEGGYIRCAHNGLVLHVKKDKQGAGLVCWKQNATKNQQWEWTGSNLICKLNGLYMDIKGAIKSPGARIIVWTSNGNYNQEWELLDVEEYEEIQVMNQQYSKNV